MKRAFALLSVILCCIFGGKGPAILSTFLTSFGIEFLFLGLKVNWGSSLIRVLVYGLSATLVASLVNSLKNNLANCQKQKQLVVSEIKDKKEILSVVSHDLKIPLTSVIMSASLLNRETNIKIFPLNAKKLINIILNSAKRMNRLIDDLLDSVRYESGKLSLNLKLHNLVEIINSSIDESNLTANQKRVNLVFDNPKNSVKISCDRERIIQVFSNIISNGVKFSQ